MANSRDPQTDREFLITLSGDINGLRKSIETLSNKIENFEEKKLVHVQNQIDDLNLWRSQWNGVWKFWLILSVAISLVLGFLNFVK